MKKGEEKRSCREWLELIGICAGVLGFFLSSWLAWAEWWPTRDLRLGVLKFTASGGAKITAVAVNNGNRTEIISNCTVIYSTNSTFLGYTYSGSNHWEGVVLEPGQRTLLHINDAYVHGSDAFAALRVAVVDKKGEEAIKTLRIGQVKMATNDLGPYLQTEHPVIQSFDLVH